MSAIRRLYYYILAFVSLEVAVWGIIGLLRTLASDGLRGASSLLATGLSLVLVGLPIFFISWRTVQREALSDPVERATRIRVAFLYGAVSATFGPVLFAILALLNRAAAALLALSANQGWFGVERSALDHWISSGVNALGLVFFWLILRQDWRAARSETGEQVFIDTRRLFRYLWMLVGLTLLVAGVYNLLRYFLSQPAQSPDQALPNLAGGIALFLVGAPLWGYFWWSVQDSQYDPAERRSLLRLVVLYLISLAAVVGVLSTVGAVITSAVRWIMEEQRTVGAFLQENNAQLGGAVPLAAMWIYYGRILQKEVAAWPDQPQRAALRRLYFYILSALGLSVMLSGLYNLIGLLAQWFLGADRPMSFWRDSASGAISALVIGLPLWWLTWRGMQVEAARADDTGDHARRSVLRKAYLYLALFLLVVGAMIFSGQFLYALLNSLLSQETPDDFVMTLARLLLWLGVDLALLVYHWRALRLDSLLAQQTLGSLHAAFPTLVLVDQDLSFGAFLTDELNRIAPRLPIALHDLANGAPDEALFAVKALVMPVGLALNPPEALRLWLAEFSGRRLLVPLARENYTWLGQDDKSPLQLAREAARALRQMAEGEALRQPLPTSPWAVAGYLLAGLFGLQILISLFSLMISALYR